MKKSFLILTVLILTFTLAGCNLIPSNAQDIISEELCRDDPDNELCILENIVTFEDTLVEQFLERITNDGIDEDCDVISVSNPDLKDTCRNNLLLPIGITTFDPLTIVTENDYYIVTGETNLDNTQLIIYMKIVVIDSVPYISEWTTLTDSVVEGEITLAAATNFITSYFDSMTNDFITGPTFCEMFYDGIDDDCDGLVEDDYRLHDTIIVTKIERIKNDHFRSYITVSKSKEIEKNSSVELIVEHYLSRESFGPVFVSKIEIENEITLDEVNLQLDAFFEYYDDNSITNDTFCQIYYDNKDNDCDAVRDDFFINYDEIVVNSITKVEDYHFRSYITLYKTDENSNRTGEDVEVEILVQRTGLGLITINSFTMKTLENSIDSINMLFNDFVANYLNSDVEDDNFELEFTIENNNLPSTIRSENIDTIESIRTIMIVPLEDDTFDVYVKVKFNEGNELSKKINVSEPLTTDTIKGTFDFMEPKTTDPDSVTTASICQMISDFGDTDIDDETFDNLYIGARNNSIVLDTLENITCDDIVSTYIYEDENRALIVLKTTNGDINTQAAIEITINKWEYTIYDVNDINVDCDGICEGVVTDIDEALRAFTTFNNNFYSDEYTNEELNNMYFDGTMNQQYFLYRPFIISAGYTATITNSTGPSEDGVFTFFVEISGSPLSGEAQPIQVKITKRIDKTTPLLELIQGDQGSIPPS